MERILESYGFIKTGTYTWYNKPYSVIMYYDGITVTKDTDKDDIVLYEGVKPYNIYDTEKLIEDLTKLKKINKNVLNILDKTKSKRIYSNISLRISDMLIEYIDKNINLTEEDVCKNLNVDKETLTNFLSGSYNFTLEEICNICVLLNDTIIIK